MKKLMTFVLCAVMALSFAGCEGAGTSSPPPETEWTVGIKIEGKEVSVSEGTEQEDCGELFDENGNVISAIKIENGELLVRYGTEWKKLGKVAGENTDDGVNVEDAIFENGELRVKLENGELVFVGKKKAVKTDGTTTLSKEVAAQIKKVNDYFLSSTAATPVKLPLDREWQSATYHLGALEAFKATGEEEYYSYTLDWAENWGYDINYGKDTDYLDIAAAMLAYTELDGIYPAERKLKDCIRNADYTLTQGELDYSWIDEIYMASSGYQYLAKATGEKAYADIDFLSYNKWREKLFDEEEGLWYRDERYIYDESVQTEYNVTPNGKKVFWSRGNTWVYTSLARNLRIMDKDNEAYETYKADFIAMSRALLSCQRTDGTWNANLGDPEHLGGIEMTGTGGFWFGLCTGIELGILDVKTYLPVVDKVWKGVKQYVVQENGLLGYCQPVGEEPAAAKASDTHLFGVGLYMMGASAYMRLCNDYEAPKTLISEEIVELETSYAAMPDTLRQCKLGTGYLTADEIESVVSQAKQDLPENNALNLVNGEYIWKQKNVGWVGGGLKTKPVMAVITLKDPTDIEQIVACPREARPYKIKVEVSANGVDFQTVADTTTTEVKPSRLYKWAFDKIEDVKYVCLTVTGIWGTATDWASINELFIYPAK